MQAVPNAYDELVYIAQHLTVTLIQHTADWCDYASLYFCNSQLQYAIA